MKRANGPMNIRMFNWARKTHHSSKSRPTIKRFRSAECSRNNEKSKGGVFTSVESKIKARLRQPGGPFLSSPTLRLVLVLVVASAGSAAQEIAGTYVLMGDSDGTKPKTGARLELTFSTVKGGSVRLFATRPGETVRD